MNTRKQDALEKLAHGYDCSRAILSVYAPYLNLTEAEAQRYEDSCCCLLGKPQEVCGAVQGAVSVIRLKLEHEAGKPLEQSIIEAKAEAFQKAFLRKNGTLSCSGLIGADLSTYEGQFKAMEGDAVEHKCAGFVADAVDLLETTFSF